MMSPVRGGHPDRWQPIYGTSCHKKYHQVVDVSTRGVSVDAYRPQGEVDAGQTLKVTPGGATLTPGGATRLTLVHDRPEELAAGSAGLTARGRCPFCGDMTVLVT
jgi:hypothetical protein